MCHYTDQSLEASLVEYSAGENTSSVLSGIQPLCAPTQDSCFLQIGRPFDPRVQVSSQGTQSLQSTVLPDEEMQLSQITPQLTTQTPINMASITQHLGLNNPRFSGSKSPIPVAEKLQMEIAVSSSIPELVLRSLSINFVLKDIDTQCRQLSSNKTLTKSVAKVFVQ